MTDHDSTRSLYFLNLEETDGLLDMARGDFGESKKADFGESSKESTITITPLQRDLIQRFFSAVVQPLMPSGHTIQTLPQDALIEGHLQISSKRLLPLPAVGEAG